MVYYYCHKNVLILGVGASKFEMIHFYMKIVTIHFQYLIFWCHRIMWCEIHAEKIVIMQIDDNNILDCYDKLIKDNI